MRNRGIIGEKELERNRDDILGAIKQLETNNDQSLSYRKLSALLDELAKNSEEVIKTQILRSLAYVGMTARQSHIPEAYQKTFEWVFRDPNIRFKDWLEADSAKHIYWVSGKPGSGKSTLMNFLYNHKQTRESLQVWTGAYRQLVLSGHFFWALGGAEKQKSLEGLLRSLLHGILKQCPDLIPLVCPAHIQHTFNSGNRDPWTLTELREGFRKITQLDRTMPSKDIAASTRFCLFIDGLDEYAGSKTDLLELCKLTIRPTHIKLCVASRSWPTFRDAFTGDGGPMLDLHELTKGDIRAYSQSQLSGHTQVIELQKQDSLAFISLVDEIVRKAEGVFLWVYLVVRSLLEGLSNDDSLSKLRQRLEQLPDDLDEYYQHVMNGIETIYKKETAQILRMYVCAKDPIPLLCLPPALQTSTYQKVDEEVARSKAWAAHSSGSIRKQLHARCRDFLQVEPDQLIKEMSQKYNIEFDDMVHLHYRVDFLHLTVKEFLERPAVAQLLKSWDSNFHEPRLLLCECYMFLLKILPDVVFEHFGYVRESKNGVQKKPHAVLPYQYISGHFVEIETTSGRAPLRIIDDYQRLMFTRTDGYTAQNLKTQAKALNWQSDSLRWALSCGLLIYAETKMKQSSVYIPEGNKCVLLYNVLQLGVSHEPPWTIDARLYIVSTLLKCGVNPNEEDPEEWMGQSSWSGWLTESHDLNLDYLRAHTIYSQTSYFGREEWLAITDILLEYGADPNMAIFRGKSSPALTPIDVFRKVFRPDQVEILMRRIREPHKAGACRSQAREEQRIETSSSGAEHLSLL